MYDIIKQILMLAKMLAKKKVWFVAIIGHEGWKKRVFSFNSSVTLEYSFFWNFEAIFHPSSLWALPSKPGV